jgi:hypothetical protein
MYRAAPIFPGASTAGGNNNRGGGGGSTGNGNRLQMLIQGPDYLPASNLRRCIDGQSSAAFPEWQKWTRTSSRLNLNCVSSSIVCALPTWEFQLILWRVISEHWWAANYTTLKDGDNQYDVQLRPRHGLSQRSGKAG